VEGEPFIVVSNVVLNHQGSPDKRVALNNKYAKLHLLICMHIAVRLFLTLLRDTLVTTFF
jgi:hypothetical protein